jgi:tRNA pseudouridine38-40 synthase
MHNIKLVISYFGAPFAGWQKTPMGLTVEESLEGALKTILQHDIALQAASRTDAGVHAEAQVVNFISHKPLCLDRLKYSLNQMLPKEIAVLKAHEMPKTFHPTLETQGKEYWYHICNTSIQSPFHKDTSWHFPIPMDLEAMRKAATHLIGTHDFSSFCNERKLWDRNPVCHLSQVDIQSLPGNRFRISLTGDHFLYRMARNLAGTLCYVGSGKILANEIPSILKNKDRSKAGVTAPAHGLMLKRVNYHDLSQ